MTAGQGEAFKNKRKEWIADLEEKNPQFCKMVQDLTKEWNESNAPGGRGSITCEFSTGRDMLHEKMAYIYGLSPTKGYWRILLCETCFGYHAEKPYHVEIMNDH